MVKVLAVEGGSGAGGVLRAQLATIADAQARGRQALATSNRSIVRLLILGQLVYGLTLISVVALVSADSLCRCGDLACSGTIPSSEVQSVRLPATGARGENKGCSAGRDLIWKSRVKP